MQKTLEKYNLRNERKKEIEFGLLDIPRNNGEVGQLWRYYEGMNIGHEISKDHKHLRVCVVLNNKLWNWLLLVAPITTKIRKVLQWKTTILVDNPKKYNLKNCEIILNQVKLIDRKRLNHKLSQKKMSLWFVRKILHRYIEIISI